ncbi:MAG: hypothetical protein J7518_20910 [Nocardioidaceae bacterium]|nr:hypothetical protein [Nocardioidaceae bacterium]
MDSATVVISAPRANFRSPVRLDRDEDGFVATTAVRREWLAGVASVEALVLDGPPKMHVIGQADPWTMVIDPVDAPRPPGAPPIEIRWVDFTAPEAKHLNATYGSYALVDFREPKPVLFLNRGIRGLQEILEGSGHKEKRRLRELLGSSIAKYTTEALFREACAQAEGLMDDDGGVNLPSDRVLADILRAVAGEVPSVETVDELLTSLQSEVERRKLWSEIDHAIDRLSGNAGVVAGVLGEVWSV